MTTTPKYVDEAVKALESIRDNAYSQLEALGTLGYGPNHVKCKAPNFYASAAESALRDLYTALSEPRYTVDEFLASLFAMAPYSAVLTHYGNAKEWDEAALRAHFEPLKGGR